MVFINRNGARGKTNGAPIESAGAFVSGFLVSLILPMAGIAYFAFFKCSNNGDASCAAAAGLPVQTFENEEKILVDQIVDALGKEL